MVKKEKWVPSPEAMKDFKKVRQALLEFYEKAPVHKALMDKADTNAAIDAWLAREAEDWKVVQLAFIHATRDDNHADRWPLIHEAYVLRVLLLIGLGVRRPKHYEPSVFAGHRNLFLGEC